MLPRRSIRLKEFPRFLDENRYPGEILLSWSDDSLIDRAYRVRTDGDGFILSGRESGREASKIVILGDSFVENIFVPETSRLCAVVEQNLSESGLETQVLNGGVSGCSTLHMLGIIATKILPLRPSLVIIANGVMDADICADEKSFWSSHEYYDPFSYDGGIETRAVSSPSQELNFENREKLLSVAIDMIRKYQIPVALTTFHHRYYLEGDKFVAKHLPLEKYTRLRERWDGSNFTTRLVADRCALDLFDIQKEYVGRNDLLYDGLHLNERGAKQIGSWLASHIRTIFPVSESDSGRGGQVI